MSARSSNSSSISSSESVETTAPRCGLKRDEALGLELAQRFADGDSAHSEFVGEGVLAKRLAVGEVAAKNALAKGFDRHAGDGLAPNGHGHARG